ncbi:RNA-binding domain-containing protein [Lindgomyces ingoldianus]|uniref:RNA-binding domain-containing protein n=1 Tax=Lindgomyces ingoldianus TaxID=673940 RepID=A0ACB6RIC4_9PLEO|nr:RNA-binding domain-containing protein [Lindgomyces ingoldianus]KAF2478221.1 RNA-binding domain-containing protein [Lindgomyces ingoldianus]
MLTICIESLKDYFSQFGEVSECTVMRDSATGRSRGFGFLTFKDPKCVNTVMVKEHYLDGKIIDPKRAIPREEQERTSKIFVGGVSQEATEEDFKNFFKQFGRVVDATLMMDKDTGRPRGFGFVTFDGDAAVDATLQGPLQILGKPIEVKRAQPRGNMRDGEEEKKFGGRGGGKFGGRNDSSAGFENQQNQNQNQQGGGNNQMTPAMMAQYWQRMQQYFQQMQHQIVAAQSQGMPNPMAQIGGQMGGQMNPAMMQQMMAMQQGGMNRPQSGSPHPQAQMGGQMGGQMNPAMMQQMQQMQQMQMQQQQAGAGFGGNQAMAAAANRPAYTAQEQLAFEQQKYEQQQARRMQQAAGYGGQGGPTSWEGMYDDIPQPVMPPQGPSGGRVPNQNFGHGHGRGGQHNRGRQGSSQPPTQPSNAPPNAPTGPKNPNKPGINYRGGGRNSNNYRHNPYGQHGRGG